MTKIDQIQPGQSEQIPKNKKPSRASQGPSFQEYLGRAAQPEKPHSATKTTAPLPPQVGGVFAPAPAPETGPLSSLQSEGIKRAERTMELLEAYVDRLGDERRSIKEVAPLVKAMEEELEGLSQVMTQLDPKDELYGILDEVGSLAAVQTIKFNRGDHVTG